VREALGGDRAIGELVGTELGVAAQILHADVDFRDQQCARHRRRQTRHEERVVAARIGARDGAARVASQSVGHQPFVADGLVPIAASLTPENQKRVLRTVIPRKKVIKI